MITLPTIEVLVIIVALQTSVNSRFLSPISTFSKQLTFQDKRIYLSTPNIVTENDSFLYAICDLQEHTFKKNYCNVTVETPAFVNATYRDTCNISLVPENPKLESMTNLRIFPFGDDKVLIFWLVMDLDYRPKVSKVRVLRMSTCKYNDISIATDKLHAVIPYENSFDVIVSGKALCNVENCRITYDSDGKKISGPAHFLSNVKFLKLASVLPVAQSLPIKGFYALAISNTDDARFQVLHVGPDGKATEAIKNGTFVSSQFVKISNAYDTYGVCWTSERTNIFCRQYDMKMNLKLSVVFQFSDDPGFGLTRWMQIHNLQEGGFLLVTGKRSTENERKFKGFTVIKVHPDGHRDRPLEVEGLGFECTKIDNFFINVSENDENEFCFHFACERDNFDHQGIRNALKFSTKYLPKKSVSMTKHRASIVN